MYFLKCLFCYSVNLKLSSGKTFFLWGKVILEGVFNYTHRKANFSFLEV